MLPVRLLVLVSVFTYNCAIRVCCGALVPVDITCIVVLGAIVLFFCSFLSVSALSVFVLHSLYMGLQEE